MRRLEVVGLIFAAAFAGLMFDFFILTAIWSLAHG